MRVFADRAAAGRALATLLQDYVAGPDVIVLALPRGGVPVGHAIAHALQLPLDVLVVRKLGVPGQPELAMGAIAPGGVRVLNPEVSHWLEADADVIEAVAMRERHELERRERAYRSDRLPLDVVRRTVIVVDDGAATGATMRAAVQALRRMGATRIVVALPTAARDACAELRILADEVVCVTTPEPFNAVGCWYREFDQTTDTEVMALLHDAQSGGAQIPS
jgi:putative phosphoribosyl transferase